MVNKVLRYREKSTYVVDVAAYLSLFFSPHELKVSLILNLLDP
jgi:hypothetical protein